MGDESTYPRMRGVDAFPAEISGQKVICLRDPLNLSGKILFLPYPVFFIASLIDGNHSVADIQTEFTRRFGEILYRERVQEVIDQLEEHFLLESERFRRAERKVIESFRLSPIRPSVLAGEAYEEDPEKLKETLESYIHDPEGHGSSGLGEEGRTLAGAIAPHIDYRRGGACYAFAHQAIRKSPPADLFIILGTAHAPMELPFALTRKHFQTPWGAVETDQEFLSRLEAGCAGDFYRDEFVHKGEHSIELQLVFLRALWTRPEPFQVVPILCGSFQEAILSGQSPLELPGVAGFIEALKKASEESGKRVCVLASADLAHMGLRFGDPEPPDPRRLQGLAEEDGRLLEFARLGDPEGFFADLSRGKNRRRVCGGSPIYVLLRLLPGVRGELLKYGQAPDPVTQSVVTFASMAFFS